MVVYNFNLSKWEAKAVLCEFKTSQVYKLSSWTARATMQWDPVSKNKNKKKNVMYFSTSVPLK